ncbi:aminotransferase class I/II-fold pyridoxal phosphate-dependent enzyme [Reichenbachiella carrageenanivorans]|uniref:Aminotransferase class I/II-fold pyridoxal phosphate-dependent enzyme n=1 Tax=Reichenbachiella carrageenanivorans TaxID=2979869 RepID=A0ABY6CVS8_9BACT|nr:GntG family PLP-dependent aldolase [Reichenbachiella carrageenanivorans]UXX78017.1 aminotransferase class I/II-fold pyridoxal phosphate-dependent enzyme [Reichenbachiella carrageenanivorans]
MIIDLRSDTVTKPSDEMLQVMMAAEVGDDVFGEDPTILMLENKIAKYFGKEAAMFCPSGTMANQIALRINTQPQDEILCDRTSHIYNYEGGGAAYNSMVSIKLLHGDLGRFTANDVKKNINPDDIHYARTSLIAIENTVNKGGGSVFPLDVIKEIAKVAVANKLKMHLDGARIFNALVSSGESALDHGKCFHTLSVCFSKGLGAPVGSALIGSKEAIGRARRVRKVMGGGMRQAGYLAAACIYALENNVDRLKDDHRRATQLANLFEDKMYVENIVSAGTNIVIVTLAKDKPMKQLLEAWKKRGLLAVPFGPNEVRLVTHLNYTDDMLQKTMEILA